MPFVRDFNPDPQTWWTENAGVPPGLVVIEVYAPCGKQGAELVAQFFGPLAEPCATIFMDACVRRKTKRMMDVCKRPTTY